MRAALASMSATAEIMPSLRRCNAGIDESPDDVATRISMKAAAMTDSDYSSADTMELPPKKKVDGENEQVICEAMAAAIKVAAGEDILAISAGNYGGKLGKFHFHLHQMTYLISHLLLHLQAFLLLPPLLVTF